MHFIDSVLGKEVAYKDKYDASLLYKISRAPKRLELGIQHNSLPFHGYDVWNAYEMSWLDLLGKPTVALAEIYISASSTYMVESKSFKLYLNSFNNTQFASTEEVCSILLRDIKKLIECEDVVVKLNCADTPFPIVNFSGINIDALPAKCTQYDNPCREMIKVEDEIVHETIYTNLLRSNCLVTGQPDWASLSIQYTGRKLQHESIIQYVVAYRNHHEFHEHCVERIFTDIIEISQASFLSVYARYTRRGGVDISPYRTTDPAKKFPENIRLLRQ